MNNKCQHPLHEKNGKVNPKKKDPIKFEFSNNSLHMKIAYRTFVSIQTSKENIISLEKLDPVIQS